MPLNSQHYTYEELKQELTKNGLKATHQRILLLEAFMLNEDHPTAEKLYNQVKSKSPALSLGTVYKTLDAFTEVGLIKKIQTAEDTIRYDFKTHSHHHLYCQKTHRIIDYEDEELKELLNDYFQKKGIENFDIKDIQLQLTGEVKDENRPINPGNQS